MQAHHAVLLQDAQLGAGSQRQALEFTFRDFIRAAPNGDSCAGLKLFG